MDHFLLEFGVRAVLVAAGTAVVLRAARVRAASTRHAAWTGVLVVMLLLPIWTAWGPKLSLKLLPAANPVATVTGAVVSLSSATATTGTPAEAAIVVPSRPDSTAWSLRHVVLAIYVGVTGVLLLRLLLGTLRVHLLIRRATLRDGLLTSASCASPLTVGWFRPIAILPQEWRRWPQGQLDAVLTHEHEHARRHDPLVQWLALLNRSVFWFHPLSWWLERQLSVLAEEACDAAVLAKGHSAQDYSEYLLRMADSVKKAGRRVSLVGMAMPGSFLPRRIPRLFDGRSASRISRSRLAGAAAAIVLFSVAFSGIALEARESESVTVPAAIPIKVAPAGPTPPPPVAVPAPMRIEVTAPSTPLASLAAQAPVPTPQAAPEQQQVEVEARLVVVNRSFTREIPALAVTRGISLGGNVPAAENGLFLLMQPGSESQLDEILAIGEARGIVRIVSRPRVTTVSGISAEISQGTQIPVQTTVNGVPVTSFLTFALKIELTPQITQTGLVFVTASVENSQPDFARAVNGVPAAVSTQQARTQFLVKDGSTAMMNMGVASAGSQTRQVPGLGTIPIIGTLFQQATAPAVSPSDSDLLIFITPRIKTP
jgi:beta-lactamase regulating signal transducer with metallopeptidase domain